MKFKKLVSAAASVILGVQALTTVVPAAADEQVDYTVPESPAKTYNLNIDWKYIRPETAFPLADAAASVEKYGKQFYDRDYDDSDWETVSVPHPINASDSFDAAGGDFGEYDFYRGFSLYRKHITIPESDAGKKLFIEFEAVRQSIYLYANGTLVGYYEAGVAPVGFDITNYVTPGEDNVIAVATDNNADGAPEDNPIPTWTSDTYGELSCVTRETQPGCTPGDGSGITYQWNTTDFNPVQGGITGNVTLYAKNSIYQTLPLYNNLKTTGNYVYATDFDISGKTAKITVESEIRNESGSDADLTVEVNVVDSDGKLTAAFSSADTAAAASDAGIVISSTVPDDAYESSPALTNADTVDVTKITVEGIAENLNFWSPDTPYLYDVYTVLKDGDTVIDVDKQTTGFRKVEYDINDGGVKINEKSVWLTGYAQRSTNEWAAIGVANDWLTDEDMKLVKESNANFIRWMHIAPKPASIRSGDKYGIVSVCPGADRETDQKGRSWDTRVEAMRDAVIYYRNSPSIIFWEAGNQSISAEHMSEMADLIKSIDPNGGRFSGSRSLGSEEQLAEADYTGTILGKANGTYSVADMKANMEAIGRYMPIIESEYAREEAPRRVWDDYSPPDYDYRNARSVNGAKAYGYDVYDHTSESFVKSNVGNYAKYYGDRIGGQTGNDYYAGAAALIWADSNQHVRNSASENCRTSGRVDAVRLKKESFYAYRVIQSRDSMCHIVGHWNYPEVSDDTYNYREKEKNTDTNYWEETGEWGKRDPENKTVYVIGTADITKMELYVNGYLVGTDSEPDSYFIFQFDKIDVTESGKVQAVGYNSSGKIIARDEISTAGDPASLKLTPVTGPDGLRADGSDIMYYDVEVVDADGNVCPLSYDRINLSISGEGVLLGGYNSGENRAAQSYDHQDVNEIGQDFVYAECGTNRIFIRSTRNAGDITLTASMDGVESATAEISSVAADTVGGLTETMQQALPRDEITDTEQENLGVLVPLAYLFTASDSNSKIVDEEETAKDEYTVYVNGTEVVTTTRSYKPDDTAGVIGEINPILDAIIAAGGDVSYEVQTEGELPDFVNEGELPMVKINGAKTVYLTNGMTTLCINEGSETNTTNYPTPCVNGILMPELVPVLSYIDGLTIESDENTKTFNITVSSAVNSSSLTALSSDTDTDTGTADYIWDLTNASAELQSTSDSAAYAIMDTDGNLTEADSSSWKTPADGKIGIAAAKNGAGSLTSAGLYNKGKNINCYVCPNDAGTFTIDVTVTAGTFQVLQKNSTSILEITESGSYTFHTDGDTFYNFRNTSGKSESTLTKITFTKDVILRPTIPPDTDTPDDKPDTPVSYFEITEIGFNEDYTKVLEIDANMNYTYSGDVIFLVCVYDSDGNLKSLKTKKTTGANLKTGGNAIKCSLSLPESYDKSTDTVNVLAWTSLDR